MHPGYWKEKILQKGRKTRQEKEKAVTHRRRKRLVSNKQFPGVFHFSTRTRGNNQVWSYQLYYFLFQAVQIIHRSRKGTKMNKNYSRKRNCIHNIVRFFLPYPLLEKARQRKPAVDENLKYIWQNEVSLWFCDDCGGDKIHMLPCRGRQHLQMTNIANRGVNTVNCYISSARVKMGTI